MESLKSEFKGLSTRDILAWRRPVASGIVFGYFFTIWFIFMYFNYTLTTFVSRIATVALIVGGAAAVTKRVVIQSPEDMSACLDHSYEALRPHVTKAVDCAVAVITWRDFTASAKVFLLTIITAFVGNWLSDATLMLLVLIGAFSVLVVYEKKQKEIDSVLKQVEAATDKYLGILKTNAAAQKTKAEQMMDEMARKNQ